MLSEYVSVTVTPARSGSNDGAPRTVPLRHLARYGIWPAAAFGPLRHLAYQPLAIGRSFGAAQMSKMKRKCVACAAVGAPELMP